MQLILRLMDQILLRMQLAHTRACVPCLTGGNLKPIGKREFI